MGGSVPTDRLGDALRVEPGSKVSLRHYDAGQTFGHERAAAEAQAVASEARLSSLQERLWAEGRHGVLIVLQGIDAAGKDGTIRHVMRAFNPQGCSVVGFKAPTAPELGHDFLWRVHQATPAKGSVAIFNRSHYEDVLVVRVHGLVPESLWRPRYRHIVDWEQMLVDEGTTILKFFLYIDRDEQRDRLQARLDDPTKQWKFSSADLPERARWDDYVAAFEECLERTSTHHAPWYLVPSNHKWFRNLAVARIVAEALEAINPQYPPPQPGIDKFRIE